MTTANASNDDFSFASEDGLPKGSDRRWKILLVDDEPDVHAVTRMALSGFSFAGRELEFISAHSGEEAKKAIVEMTTTTIAAIIIRHPTDRSGLVATHGLPM